MTRVRLAAGVLALGLLAAGQATAQRTGPIIGAENKVPGVLNAAERFAAADADKDGKVSKDEFKATLIADAKPYFSAIWKNRDTDKDGSLTQAEMTTNGQIQRPGPSGTLGPSSGDAPPPGQAAAARATAN